MLMLGVTSSVHAESNAQDRAMAQSLFEDGRALMQSANHAAACPKLAESHRLDPAGGTLLNLGVCYEKAGKIASAWVTYEEAYQLARREGRADREEYTRAKLDELEPRVSHVVIQVPEAARVDGLRVVLGERALSSAAWGSPLPLDTGQVTLRVTAPGRKPWIHQVHVEKDGIRATVEVPVLENDAVATAPPPPSPAARRQPRSPSPKPRPLTQESGTPVLGYVIGGVGMASLGVGGYFGTKAMSTWKDRKDECDGNDCSSRGLTLDADTNRYANYANVGVGVGLLGLGIGTFLVLSSGPQAAPSTDSGVAVAPMLSPTGVGARGSW